MTIPLPAFPSARHVALRWLATVIPDLQAGKSLLTPIDSWAGDIFATASYISAEPDPYTPLRDSHVQIDVWGRPSPSGQYRGVPINRCDAIAEYLEDLTIHFNPLVLTGSGNYTSVRIADAYVTDKASAVSEQPAGMPVALARARVTVCFRYITNQ